jgi:single-strand DNA-binding protein
MAFTGFFSGHIGRDPELKYLDTGGMVANFTVAVRQPKRNGEDRPPRWVKVAVWGKSAEYVGNYVKKGDGVICYGRVEPPEVYQDRQGESRVVEKFTADNIEKWSDAKPRQGDAQPGVAPAAAAPAVAPAPRPAAPAVADDEIPF